MEMMQKLLFTIKPTNECKKVGVWIKKNTLCVLHRVNKTV